MRRTRRAGGRRRRVGRLVSLVLGPSLWFEWVRTMLSNDAVEAGASFLPIPYWLRGLAAIALAVWAGRQPERVGDPLAAIAVVVALPTWWARAFATLLAAWKLRPWRGTTRLHAPAI